MSRAEALPEELAAVLAQFPGPVAIRPSTWLQLSILTPVFLLAAFAAIEILPDLPVQGRLLIGGIIAVPVGVLGWLLAFSFVRDLPRVTLDAEGFGLWGVAGADWIRWRDVGRFNSGMGFVVFAKETPPEQFWAKMNAWRMFPGLYRLKSEEISCLMAAWRERALMHQG
jgi:hypothetical protein